MTERLLSYETEALLQGFRFVLGVDEAGRGPLAGPVVASAVCLKDRQLKTRIDDSKKLSPKAREKAFHEIIDKAFVGIGIISEQGIDEINILNASFLSMEIAINRLIDQLERSLKTTVDPKDVLVLVDGNMFRSKLPYRYKTIVGGDAASLSIASASIIAKTYRDRVMDGYDRIFPVYGFKKHKGYPTSAHRLAIHEHGLSAIHRKTFHRHTPLAIIRNEHDQRSIQ